MNGPAEEDVASSGDEGEENDNEAEENDNEPEDEEEEGSFFNFHETMNVLNVPMVPGGPITVRDQLLIELAHMFRYKNSYAETIEKLKRLKRLYPDLSIPVTKKSLWKCLGRDESTLRFSLRCGVCQDEVGTRTKVHNDCTCQRCGRDRGNESLSSLVILSIKGQLQNLFKTPGIITALQYRDTREKQNIHNIEDIYDGEKYKELRRV